MKIFLLGGGLLIICLKISTIISYTVYNTYSYIFIVDKNNIGASKIFFGALSDS